MDGWREGGRSRPAMNESEERRMCGSIHVVTEHSRKL